MSDQSIFRGWAFYAPQASARTKELITMYGGRLAVYMGQANVILVELDRSLPRPLIWSTFLKTSNRQPGPHLRSAIWLCEKFEHKKPILRADWIGECLLQGNILGPDQCWGNWDVYFKVPVQFRSMWTNTQFPDLSRLATPPLVQQNPQPLESRRPITPQPPQQVIQTPQSPKSQRPATSLLPSSIQTNPLQSNAISRPVRIADTPARATNTAATTPEQSQNLGRPPSLEKLVSLEKSEIAQLPKPMDIQNIPKPSSPSLSRPLIAIDGDPEDGETISLRRMVQMLGGVVTTYHLADTVVLFIPPGSSLVVGEWDEQKLAVSRDWLRASHEQGRWLQQGDFQVWPKMYRSGRSITPPAWTPQSPVFHVHDEGDVHKGRGKDEPIPTLRLEETILPSQPAASPKSPPTTVITSHEPNGDNRARHVSDDLVDLRVSITPALDISEASDALPERALAVADEDMGVDDDDDDDDESFETDSTTSSSEESISCERTYQRDTVVKEDKVDFDWLVGKLEAWLSMLQTEKERGLERWEALNKQLNYLRTQREGSTRCIRSLFRKYRSPILARFPQLETIDEEVVRPPKTLRGQSKLATRKRVLSEWEETVLRGLPQQPLKRKSDAVYMNYSFKKKVVEVGQAKAIGIDKTGSERPSTPVSIDRGHALPSFVIDSKTRTIRKNEKESGTASNSQIEIDIKDSRTSSSSQIESDINWLADKLSKLPQRPPNMKYWLRKLGNTPGGYVARSHFKRWKEEVMKATNDKRKAANRHVFFVE